MKVLGIVYEDLIRNYKAFLEYAFKNSDVFSVITHLKNPDFNPLSTECRHDKILQTLKPYLVRQIIGIQRWSNDNSSDNHTVMKIYASNKDSLEKMYLLDNFLLSIQNDLPEDLCFYKKNKIWISTVSHEDLAFLYSTSKNDLHFLESNHIDFFSEGSISPYKLPQK